MQRRLSITADHGSAFAGPLVVLTAELVAGTEPVWTQIIPAGTFRARDGRPKDLPFWRMDAAAAKRVIDAFNAEQYRPVVDYEHQTLHAEKNGKDAPAAGWIQQLEWREGDGLYALVAWTDRARELIRANEYRHFSPVFGSDEKTGAVTKLLMGALTNFPGLDGLLPVAATFDLSQEDAMSAKNQLTTAILVALSAFGCGVAKDASEEQLIEALNGLQGVDLVKLRKNLGLPEDADGEAILQATADLSGKVDEQATQIAALKADGVGAGKHISIEAFEAVKTELAALKNERAGEQVDALVAEGLDDGRLLPAQESWARDLGGKDITALKTYLETTQPIAALRGTQSGGRNPSVPAGKSGLTPDQLAICTATGIDPEDYAKQLAATAG